MIHQNVNLTPHLWNFLPINEELTPPTQPHRTAWRHILAAHSPGGLTLFPAIMMENGGYQ
jgi:hypothetical protein